MARVDKERVAKDLIDRVVTKFLDNISRSYALAEIVDADQEYMYRLCAQLVDLAASCTAETTDVPGAEMKRMFGELFEHYRAKALAKEALSAESNDKQ